ncbi:DUF4198 domain-containing protein [Nitrosospira lacus]|uniref:DUF4198 domain-containing protein n=1 Tax=Nitrosospira lacus TaxID=1288494 RepID=A0A1W6SKL4_9PROT|nr:DUF4198 domain-containing protein [Nitrosospira lacus]ARO86350.1 DUF4198 domain-containing protein [Nitrosospira lacus]
MKFTQMTLAAVAAIVSGFLSLDASAHALWLENDAKAVKLYFGEYSENLRETSPGRLDGIVEPTAVVIDATGKESPVKPIRENGYFAIPGSTTGNAVLVQALKQPIREPQGENPAPVSKRFLYARFGKGGSLPLDIENTGNLLRLSFMGKPAAKTEVIIIAPNGWEKHLTTDEKGEVSFSLPESGLYVIEAKYELRNPGEFEGKAYAIESHKVTFSIYK